MNKSSWQLYVLWLVRYYFRLWFWRNGTSNSQFRRKIPSSLNLHSIMSHVCLVLVHWTLGMASPYFSSLKQESQWDLSSPTAWRKVRWWSEKSFFQLTQLDHVNGGHKIHPWKGHLKPTKKGHARKNRSTPRTRCQSNSNIFGWIPTHKIFTALTNFKEQNAIF